MNISATEDFYDTKKTEIENQSGGFEKAHENEISLLGTNNASTFNPQVSNILNKEDEKGSDGNLSEPEEKSSIQQKIPKTELKNDYIARLELSKIEKKKEKEKPAGQKSNMNKDVSDKEDKSPLKPAQKITITKNAMKTRDPNKIDYGVSGVDEHMLGASGNKISPC